MSQKLSQLNPNIAIAIANVQKNIGYAFKDSAFLQQALLHRSALGPLKFLDAHKTYSDNDRLEFLGDAVLGLCITEFLSQSYPLLDAGELSKLRATFVKEASLATIARKIQLGDALILGPGETTRDSILADGLEALIGAVFLDGGFIAAKTAVTLFFSNFNPNPNRDDAKSDLQELTQKLYKSVPSYRVLTEEGPDHNRVFEVAVFLDKRQLAVAKGLSKKRAEQKAAEQALVILNSPSTSLEGSLS